MPILAPLVTPHGAAPPHHPPHYLLTCFWYPMSPHMILGCHILVIFTVLQKNRLLVKIGHFEAFLANFGDFDLALGHSRVAPKGFFLLYYPYPVPKLLAETFLGLGPDLVHLIKFTIYVNVSCQIDLPYQTSALALNLDIWTDPSMMHHL